MAVVGNLKYNQTPTGGWSYLLNIDFDMSLVGDSVNVMCFLLFTPMDGMNYALLNLGKVITQHVSVSDRTSSDV